jgi:hypothetical protein
MIILFQGSCYFDSTIRAEKPWSLFCCDAVYQFTAALMGPITLELDAVLAKYETEVRPAVARLVPGGFGLAGSVCCVCV